MNNKMINVTMLLVGATIGSVITWKCLDKKYKRMAQDEIDSVKEVFYTRSTAPNTLDVASMYPQNVLAEQARKKPDLNTYTSVIQEHEYTDYTSFSKPRHEEEEEVIEDSTESAPEEILDEPVVIAPEEFGENEEYEKISLTYYSDHFLADEDDHLVENIEDSIGFSSLDTFGDYEDDSVFVRNDRLKCYYEILADNRKYSEIKRRKPHEVE